MNGGWKGVDDGLFRWIVREDVDSITLIYSFSGLYGVFSFFASCRPVYSGPIH